MKRVKVKVRVGGHLTRRHFEAYGISVDLVGNTGVVVSLYDDQDNLLTTNMWPVDVVEVVIDHQPTRRKATTR